MAALGTTDGSVRIGTSFDTGGFDAGIKKMMGSVGKLGAALGLAFSVGALINFGKQAVSSAAEAGAAMAGLESVVNATGRSFQQAESFIKSYAEDGLVSASAATEAYKNMLLRGYDTSQIEQMMQIMKDAAVYNRQAGFTMDEAITRTAQGLRMENSLLTDSAGIQKNVAKMWQEYAKSIGTTANNLTEAQKRQAEFNGFVAEGGIYAGSAAGYLDSYGGRMAQLSASFLNLRIAVGNSIIPVISRVLPYIKAAVDALTRWFNRIALIMSLLFGVNISAQAKQTQDAMGGVADATNAAADAQQNLADKTAAAGKAAKGALAPFDELNVLQQSETGDGAGVGAGLEALAGGGLPDTLATPALDTSETDAGIEALQEKIERFKRMMAGWFEPMKAPLARLGEAFRGLGQTIMEGLGWAWENILQPIFEWVARDLAPVAIDLLASSLELLDTIIKALEPTAQWLWEMFLQPLATWTGGAIIQILTDLKVAFEGISDWVSNNQELFANMTLVVASFLGAWEIGTLITNIVTLTAKLWANTTAWIANTVAKISDKAETLAIMALYALDWIEKIVIMAMNLWVETNAWIANTAAKLAATIQQYALIAATTIWNGICSIATAVTAGFSAVLAFLTSPIGLVVLAIAVLIIIIIQLVRNWDKVKAKAIEIWDGIREKWGKAGDWFREKVTDPIKNAFKTAGEWINDKFSAALNGIKRTAADVVNSVIRMLNKIQFSIPDWVPGIGGKSWGINISEVSWGNVPAYASGGVIAPNKPQLALVGDHRTQRELIAPEDMIRKIVREETAENQKNSAPQMIENRIYWGRREIYREIKRVEKQQGKSLMAGAGA